MTDINGAAPAIAKALQKRGYETLTPVQLAMLDPALETADALVSAQTGSGKTVAFGMAMARTLLDDGEKFGRAAAPLALVIAPTRELAMQVKRELDWLYAEADAVITSCVGGMDIRAERRSLERGAHIVVGTPGRICDHIRRNALDMTEIRVAVLDEADEMLDLGFREDLEYILEAAPAERRTLMFSATVPSAIAKLAKSYQRNAVRIATASEQKQHVDIEYRALVVTPADREHAIVNALRFYEAPNAIVFCSTRAAVNHLHARLANRNFSVVALSGELTQTERTHALQAMRDGRARVCIATDVAARGIDLPGLELVIHADLPTNSETLLHRSGRTGRAGRKGVSALIVPVSQRRKAERLLAGAQVEPTWARPPSAEEVTARDEERLFADPIFEEIAKDEEEQGLIDKLVARFDATKLASAFVSLYRGKNSAPEDITEVSLETRKPREGGNDSAPRPLTPRGDFGAAVWFSLSVGRKQRAEPRWLIPTICRAGDLTKHEIGAIKMQADETFVEIAAAHADKFMAKLGKDGMMERGVRVTRLDGVPDFSKFSRGDDEGFVKREGPRLDKPYKDNKPFSKDGPRSDKPFNKDKPYGDKPFNKDKPAGAKPYGDAPRKDWKAKPAGANVDRRVDDEVWGENPKSNFTKKPGDKPFNKAGGDKPFKKPTPKGGFDKRK
ncbi:MULTISPECIES: DEAD/DEAH box helicase [unclassified Rhizobium]|uniref:DEAD/DEAH box helicase n=1 Tax=unclassified Rhizobium TaxID=2613769 RepID=UPI001AE2A282|nr:MULTISPECIES: DEAD/DEAH box helicase [unclassified Rhizobium]MBP2462367.1 ATP-dependent RNA helicase DeaD [Rhizobium sp. PvP014]MBP2529761.1 ATP-dependent RNA helicase DeaD [Rhizobium sp. PvP099]